jgi:GNAT superfamily N-acetyltransferase
MDIALRPVEFHDEAFLRRLYASTRDNEMALVDWSDEQKTAFLGMQFDAQHRYYHEHYPEARFDVIEYHDEPIGRLYVHYRLTEIRVIDIALLPEHCGRGLGTRLIGQILAQAARAGLPVTIHVEQFNPALRLYRRLGFKDKHIEGIYLLMEWRPKVDRAILPDAAAAAA